MININPQITDPQYRYKMNKIKTCSESRGNGIKTILQNLDIVSNDLKRDPLEILKFIGLNKGSQSFFENKKYIIMGSFTTNEIQENIYKYIKMFVLCSKCKLPETMYTVADSVLYQKCSACSNSFIVDHKLSSFIIKHLKENEEISVDDF